MAEKPSAHRKEARNRSLSHIKRLQRQYRLLLFLLVLIVTLVYGTVYLQNLNAEGVCTRTLRATASSR